MGACNGIPGPGAGGAMLQMGPAAASAAEVGRMVDSSQAEDRKMIRLVRSRRLLYARSNMPVASYYTQVKGLWEEVAREMGWSGAYFYPVLLFVYLLRCYARRFLKLRSHARDARRQAGGV